MDEFKHYESYVPSHDEFIQIRSNWRKNLSEDSDLRRLSINALKEATKYRYGSQWDWQGIPIIRLPDDVMLQQELMFDLRPSRIVETGVARGGSLALSVDLMRIMGLAPRVLGVDIKIFPHTKKALESRINDGSLNLLEGDSISNNSIETIREFLRDSHGPALAILDSNHSHDHVFRELDRLAPLFPIGSIIMVADTIVAEFPHGFYKARPWDSDSNPLTALNAFLESNANWGRDPRYSRRGLFGEFRDGIIRRFK